MSIQEVKRLEPMEKLKNKSLKQHEVARLLGISVRQIRRIQKRYNNEGVNGLISKKRGVRSNHQLPEEHKKKALQLILKKYFDFGPTLAHEKLTEQEGLTISVGSVRNLMIGPIKPRSATGD